MKSFYTVEEAASRLGIHSKTLLRYLKEGTVEGHKLGGKWRIPASAVGQSAPTEAKQPTTTITIEATESAPPRIHCSTVVDINDVSRSDGERLSTMIVAVLNGKDPALGQASYNYIYYPEERKARHLLWGSPAFISTMLTMIEEIQL